MKTVTLAADPEFGFVVTQGDMVGDKLGRDEALGVIAHILFGNGSTPPYMKPQAAQLPKLLPCSHCGNLDSVILNTDGESSFTQVICSAKASGCGSSGGFKATKEQAIELWNSRATA